MSRDKKNNVTNSTSSKRGLRINISMTLSDAQDPFNIDRDPGPGKNINLDQN